MSAPTHYDVLGVPRSASQAEVRAAYRAAARDHHPDAGGDAGRMQALNVAWGVLGDPVRRAAYDQRLATGGAYDTADRAPDGSDTVDTPDWPGEPGAGLTAEEWADLADGRPIAPTMALEGWWAILPPATLVFSMGLFGAGIFFTSSTLIVFAAAVLILAVGLFVLAPLRAMTRRPPGRPSR